MTSDVAQRVAAVRARVAAACARAGRDVGEVTLVGACKRQPQSRLQHAYEAGIRCFGENIVQEAAAHREILPPDVEWHLIGPLQSNKAKKAVTLFTWVHSVDRIKIARTLEREARARGVVLHGLIEVNLATEASKHGFSPQDLGAIDELASLEHLRIAGLMAIPPFESDPEASRPWFRRLRELRDEVFSRSAWAGRPSHLSMGMSADIEIAIEEGASHVRVGTDLFGPREPR